MRKVNYSNGTRPFFLCVLAAGCSLFVNLDDAPPSSVPDAAQPTGDASVDVVGDRSTGAPPVRYLTWAGGYERGDAADIPSRAVYRARINADGSLDAWIRGPDLPAEVALKRADTNPGGVVGMGAKLFVFDLSGLYSTSLGANGTLAPFRRQTSPPAGFDNSCPLVVGTRMYLAGDGQIAYASIGDANIGGWTVASTVGGQSGIALGTLGNEFVEVENGKAFAIALQPDGAPGTSWRAIAAPSLAGQRGGNRSPLVSFGSRLYMVGGYDGSVQPQASVFRITAPLNGAWDTVEPFIDNRTRHSAVAAEEFIYLAGGWLASVPFTRVLADGSLAVWRTTAPLPQALAGTCRLGVLTPP
jgi:hypothetical protein